MYDSTKAHSPSRLPTFLPPPPSRAVALERGGSGLSSRGQTCADQDCPSRP